MTPAWLAAYVVTLANSTGWSEEYITWQLPLARGLQYQHAVLCLHGCKTVQMTAGVERELADISTKLNIEELSKVWQPLL